MKGNACIPALKALGDETRMRIVRYLTPAERNVTQISGDLKLSTYNASKHLRVLHEAGLVLCRKDGRQRLYSIPAKWLAQLQESGEMDLGCCSFKIELLPR